MRRRAKTINFGLLYGMEAFGLADRLGISRDEARHHIDEYFAQFPNVKAFMDGVVTQARNQGYTTTLFGRRRYLPELKSDNFRIRQMGERMALNAPVQGTAADIIKRAMIDLDQALRERELQTAMLLQIHDELILESPPGSSKRRRPSPGGDGRSGRPGRAARRRHLYRRQPRRGQVAGITRGSFQLTTAPTYKQPTTSSKCPITRDE